jgi:hypothetical protein
MRSLLSLNPLQDSMLPKVCAVDLLICLVQNTTAAGELERERSYAVRMYCIFNQLF